MKKRDEIADPSSCLSKATDDEILFILLSRDSAAPATIRFWCAERVRRGKNTWADPKIIQALECAWGMANQRRIELAEKKSKGLLSGDEFVEFNQLQTECFDYLYDKYPMKLLDEKRLEEIEARSAAIYGSRKLS